MTNDDRRQTDGPKAGATNVNGGSSAAPRKKSLAATLEQGKAGKASQNRRTSSIIEEAIQQDQATSIPDAVLTQEELSDLHTSHEFIQLLRSKQITVGKIKRSVKYEHDLGCLQIELVKMQRSVEESGKRVVALPKPTQEETGQWYFQRYIRHLPNRGEIVFFDRSWYNRAVVEPVNNFCSPDQYEEFMRQVPEFEHMLVEDGVTLIKFWFSISKDVQWARFESRRTNPLKQWKLSPLDGKAQELWEDYTAYKEVMFSRTHNSFSPWIILKANNKRRARLESMRYVLSSVDYKGKDEARTTLVPDPNTVMRFHRSAINID